MAEREGFEPAGDERPRVAARPRVLTEPPTTERSEEDGGEGGIRTPVPVTRQDAFEAPPLRPLRYLSVLLLHFASERRCWKNRCMTARHSSSRRPPVAVIRWLSAGCSCARMTDSMAPAFGSRVP